MDFENGISRTIAIDETGPDLFREQRDNAEESNG